MTSKLTAALILTIVGGCGHCGHCDAEPVPEAKAAKPKIVDACPAGVPNCQCGCAAGGFCTCGVERHPADDGSGDMGYWRGDVLLYRWVAASNSVRFFKDGKYGPPIACAVQRMPSYTVTGCPGGRCR